MLFSSGWGLADVESDLRLLVSSLQQQQPRSFFHLAAIRIQHRPNPLVTNSIYLPPLRTSMTSPTITLWTPLIGRRVIWQTCLLPRSSNQAISLFFCWEETRIFFVDFHEIFWTIGLECFDLDSSSFLTCYSATTHSETQPHRYIPIHFTDSLIGYNICYYVTFEAVVTSNVKAKRCYEDGCIRHRTPTPAKTPASHPPLRRILQPGEWLLKPNSDRRTMKY